jgi:branched-chain amino acid transport system ATP-binding protein
VSLLETRGVSVRFGGHTALHVVDLDAEAGAVTGLIGPNGAGKTTLVNAVTGLQPIDGGRVSLDGVDLHRLKPHQRARLGIARTFQRLEVFGSLTVRENVLIGAELRKSWGHGPMDPAHDADGLLERLGLVEFAAERADTLPTGHARMVELGRALATRPRVLLLDEPASGLSDTETETLSGVLGELAASGIAVLLVEHDVRLVMEVCTSIHVLDYGALLAVGTPAEIRTDPKVLDAYLGTPVAGGGPG